jgi:hypothetical protein
MLELGEVCTSIGGTTRYEGTTPRPRTEGYQQAGYQNHPTARARLGYEPIYTEFVAMQIVGTLF